jgi:uncharacterized protein YxjI
MTELQPQPTRYLIQEKHLSLDHRFTITDKLGFLHYNVNSIFFAMGHKLLLCDANENELIRIRQEILHLHLTFKLFLVRPDTTEVQLASIKRTGPLWQYKLEISSPNGKYIMEKKDGPSSSEYILTKNGKTVAVATKDASPTKILYWVDINDKDENHAFVLAIVIVLSCT